jgi:basic membrane lipoprotein Med (substrate-binding protein (PBP1-ABC) superfamily)
MSVFKRISLLSFLVVLSLVVLVACGNEGTPSGEGAIPGQGSEAVGFLFVGTSVDYGYNQAAYLGSVGVEEAFPELTIFRSENVPETAEAERVMEEMIRSGAKIIFPTSYGHLDPALEVAKRHPDVAFFHQGGLMNAENLGTYFGNIWQAVYLSGVAAGHMTESNKLGYVVSVPIPQVLLNVNAFTLGAQSVNPDIETTVVFTGSWCDPGQQSSAVSSMANQGIDVITQHQDCTRTIIEAADRLNIKTVGYHADASALAPDNWITGSIWNWSELYVDMVKTALAGQFHESPYSGQYRVGMAENVVHLAPFGNKVPQEVQDKVLALQEALLAGEFHPFTGPIYDQNGEVKIAEGVTPDTHTLESTNYLVRGVRGNIPR